MAQPPPPPQQSSQPWPLYDLFLDLPHPNSSKTVNPGPFLIPSPIACEITHEIQKLLPNIARFAFPEYDAQEQPTNFLNTHDIYASQSSGFTGFTFTLQLSSGSRLHGHVRRCMPPHLTARTRYDIGRRGERALVILTRATGADSLYAAILKSIEAISSQQAALSKSVTTSIPHGGNPQQWFLHQLSRYQQHLSQIYASQKSNKPLVASIPGLELGDDDPKLQVFKNADMNRFIIPTSLLKPTSLNNIPTASIVPLIRCVGVAHTIRILSALLSERRVVLISSSPTRLTSCSHAAVSMLAVGLMHWQHLYIPVLPPHLWEYLAAPYPYLIGMLASMSPRLDRTDGLGEVLIIHLDHNDMQTRNIDQNQIQNRLPDLFQISQAQQQQMATMAATSASEQLAQDLFEVLKQDKRILYGESTLDKVGETAVKATKAVKRTFGKLQNRARQYLKKGQSGASSNGKEDEPEQLDEEPEEVNSLAPDYIYTESCHNEATEEEVRVAFTTFYLCMFGDLRWYLSQQQGGLPVLDRNKFLGQKRALGDGEGTPMWPLLNNFCQTQMLEEYAKARIEEIRSRVQPPADAPLFLKCAGYLRQRNLDFDLLNCRRITRQVADGSQARLTGMLPTNARQLAMALTSNKTYEGNYQKAISNLVEQCRECTSVLFDVMSVIWLRLRDSKGLQWKHGYQALVLLRNLLYHGPMAVIAEATDGMSKIRAMKYYDNIRSSCATQVRTIAKTVYSLLVDRVTLFQVRRICADRRRAQGPDAKDPKLVREPRVRIGVPFRNIHAMMHPSASSGTVVPIPPKAPASQTMIRGQQPQQGTTNDLIGAFGTMSMGTGPVAPAASSNVFDSFATPPTQPPQAAAPPQIAPSISVQGSAPVQAMSGSASVRSVGTAVPQSHLPNTGFSNPSPVPGSIPIQQYQVSAAHPSGPAGGTALPQGVPPGAAPVQQSYQPRSNHANQASSRPRTGSNPFDPFAR